MTHRRGEPVPVRDAATVGDAPDSRIRTPTFNTSHLDAGLLLIEPTRFTLRWLADFETVAVALDAAPYHDEGAVA